jgi:hypothetical protein
MPGMKPETPIARNPMPQISAKVRVLIRKVSLLVLLHADSFSISAVTKFSPVVSGRTEFFS